MQRSKLKSVLLGASLVLLILPLTGCHYTEGSYGRRGYYYDDYDPPRYGTYRDRDYYYDRPNYWRYRDRGYYRDYPGYWHRDGGYYYRYPRRG